MKTISKLIIILLLLELLISCNNQESTPKSEIDILKDKAVAILHEKIEILETHYTFIDEYKDKEPRDYLIEMSATNIYLIATYEYRHRLIMENTTCEQRESINKEYYNAYFGKRGMNGTMEIFTLNLEFLRDFKEGAKNKEYKYHLDMFYKTGLDIFSSIGDLYILSQGRKPFKYK